MSVQDLRSIGAEENDNCAVDRGGVRAEVAEAGCVCGRVALDALGPCPLLSFLSWFSRSVELTRDV